MPILIQWIEAWGWLPMGMAGVWILWRLGRGAYPARSDELDEEARAMLRLAPIAKEIMDDVRERLPEGTDFGLLILVPNQRNPKAEGRIVAMTTDRVKVAVGAAQWVMDVLDPNQPEES